MAPISTDNYLGSVILLPSIYIAPIWIASVWDDMILNGRTFGDTLGKYTCHEYGGSSVVDYAIVSENILSLVKYFTVHDFLPDLSDHSMISVRIKCKPWLNMKSNKPTLSNIHKHIVLLMKTRLYLNGTNSVKNCTGKPSLLITVLIKGIY